MKFTAAAAITVFGLTAFCCSTVKGVEANELKLRAREKMRKDKVERQLQANDAGLVFSRGYVCITRQQDFAFVIPQQQSIVPTPGQLGELNLLGSSTIQSGGIYDPADVQIIDRLGTSAADNFLTDKRGQFAGQRQPKFIPQKDPGFFFNGECVATQVAGAQILGHSCLLNLCLGGGGYNCLAIYAGSKFVFNPFEQTLVATFEGGKNVVPSLPPSYPGTIIGGTGLFVGAVGYIDVTTITGSTLTPAERFPDESNPNSGSIDANFPQAGYITQKINVVTNVPLPVAP
ncbi:hypothetical protein FRACYDRAFT_254793 [Fragilariopsis cylindrus CCMP1102]|uniref:Uncharacterized protein n=1 Tax=Fragilariopsis cylindrus CCMP1102 TaxID=635003 RepID=A0A1E7EKA4_9STRA|nr:hypothetical protein FRACYDRAFT_254793 [Fragilariopsis cylindrus CCMP1102]|eukprot:OEU06359.1 hypothetical protein FRACYDRAFT_254793 [Fragilariopsis cylindrus CCMP1102]